MILDEQFDADEILRDVDDHYIDDEDAGIEEEMRELNFGTLHDRNANFSDMVDEIEPPDDEWD